ncbi:hypothetical protein WN944_006164 [Citrus x changshan-huyou]|uniref:Uncharacterized protein n=1 Tax=Citrus x changshan-huyou TaxID=2935761 RepID=A0AAP0MNI4_9ROSI
MHVAEKVLTTSSVKDKQTPVLENRQIHGYITFYGGGNKTTDFRAAAADVIQVRAAATVFKFEHGDCTTRSRRREKDGELDSSSST